MYSVGKLQFWMGRWQGYLVGMAFKLHTEGHFGCDFLKITSTKDGCIWPFRNSEGLKAVPLNLFLILVWG